jgi:hypothetical protein
MSASRRHLVEDDDGKVVAPSSVHVDERFSDHDCVVDEKLISRGQATRKREYLEQVGRRGSVLNRMFNAATLNLSESHDSGTGPCLRCRRDLARTRESSWRRKLGTTLENHYVHLLVLILVIVDVVCVFGELLLHFTEEEEQLEAAEHSTGGHSTGEQAEGHHATKAEHAEHALHIVSLSILSVLAAQQVLLIVAFGRKFFLHAFYVLDLVVVATALALETIDINEGGFVVAVMGWRILRLVHGLVVSAELEHHEVEALQHRLKFVTRNWRYTTSRFYGLQHRARVIQAAWRTYSAKQLHQ